jgi:hypothetical protein
MPSTGFGLLLVEGGDELAVCQVLAGTSWTGLCGWKADGRDLPRLAQLAKLEANFGHARSIGIIVDAEESVVSAQGLVNDTLRALGVTTPFVHGALTGSPRIGAFEIRRWRPVLTSWSVVRAIPTAHTEILEPLRTKVG